jgi:hypothetical protein
MRMSATFPLLPGLALPSVPALFGALSAAPAAVEAQRQLVAVAVASVQAPVVPATAQNFDDLDLDQRVRLIGEW